MNDREQLIEAIEKHGSFGKGRVELLNHLHDKRLVRGRAIKAKCYDCTGYYADGRVDCENPDCPLYPYMPYRGKGAEVEEVDIEEMAVEEEMVLA